MWDTPPGVQVVGLDGAVEPRFLRSDINVSLDAERFIYVNPFVSNDTLQGGVHKAGSNVLDGDGQTYWEPERDTAIETGLSKSIWGAPWWPIESCCAL